jgi:signal recognition particle subunit SRP54
VPIKFIGTGEHLDALEPFRPEGMAGRILGLGDVLALVGEVRKVVDMEEQAALEAKMRAGEFTLDDFKVQQEKMSKPGLVQKMMGLMPGMGEFRKMIEQEDTEGGIRQTVGIIDSMTPEERRNPKVIDPSRRNRIARGAGVEPQDVNQLVRQYEMVSPLMKAMAGKGIGDRMAAIRDLQSSGLLDPGSRGPKIKKGTGKRLTSKERADLKKRREKELRRKKRRGKDQS